MVCIQYTCGICTIYIVYYVAIYIGVLVWSRAFNARSNVNPKYGPDGAKFLRNTTHAHPIYGRLCIHYIHIYIYISVI